MTELAIAPLSMPQVRSATDQVFLVLYEAVISLKLPPGTKVTEIEIANHLDVSRQPVRDAFFRLSKLGFLAMRPQRATVVTLISEQAVFDALFTRTALEVECLREAMPRMTAAAKGHLETILNRQEASISGMDPAEFHELDEAFHEALCDVASQSHVWRLIREQKAHMDRIRFLTLSEERRRHVLAEHRALFEAMKNAEFSLAEDILRDHLRDIRTVLDQARAEFPDYFDGPRIGPV